MLRSGFDLVKLLISMSENRFKVSGKVFVHRNNMFVSLCLANSLVKVFSIC